MTFSTWIHHLGDVPRSFRESVAGALKASGIEPVEFAQGGCPGLLLFSTVDEGGKDFVRDACRNGRNYVLAGCCGELSAQGAWQMMDAGAADVVCCADPRQGAEEIGARLKRWRAVEELMGSPPVLDTVAGKSPPWQGALRQIVEAAHFTDSSILILGESGTGKELVARLVHALDPRPAKKEFIVLDCSTVVPELSGSEFFGHERGAFTSAVSAREGAFALADGGTLFLDEVGELPLHLQTQLLRAIQEQTYKRVGGNAWQRTSFRLVCATNRDLTGQIHRGEFRADLYYRLAGFICNLPPLRERPEDILLLARHFLKELRPEQPAPELQAPVQEYLLQRDYPGNVRDLRQVMARMLCRHCGSGPITVGCIPPGERLPWKGDENSWEDGGFERAIRRALVQGVGLKRISRVAEETAIRIAVDETGGNLQQAALRLGVTDRTLQLRRAAQRQQG